MEPTWQTTDGSVRLYLGDCEPILPQFVGVDVVVTDPPYEITAAGGGIGRSRRYLQQTEGFTDCGFDYAILDQFANWMCFGTLRQVPHLIDAAGDRRWMLVTWNKPNPCPLVNGNYLPDTEYIIHAWRKGGLHGNATDKSRFIVHPLGDKEHGEHPNEKPVRVMRKLLANASAKGQVVFDPYMGSGTTAVACLRMGRRFVGIERDPHWYEVAKQRVIAELNRAPLFEEPPQIQRSLLEADPC